ncbi:GntR family transcriptional regulator [Thalassospira sp.]|uniref:GntR family transcriptional regulator n=1 Tax=Thalassospira sp. TaxID=1912094 RepID=UPI002734D15D|nr:GntR family transcriptional regulator [Thalassospira sp.]MDP2697945.1 GntR family transcriptional regulator [Thalassospira sp.]
MINAADVIASLRARDIENTGHGPLYRRLQVALKAIIDDGVLKVQDALPSERDLATELNISRVTVRNAVRALVEDGVLVQRHGAGTFVAPRVEQALSRLTSFTEDMTTRGLQPGAIWLEKSVGHASPEEAMALNLSPGTEVSRLRRLRTANDKPMALEFAVLPRAFLPSPEDVDKSLYDALARHGKKPDRALQRLRAELFDAETAKILGVPEGSAALYIERRSFLANGTPVEFTRSYYRGDSYDFIAEMQVDAR